MKIITLTLISVKKKMPYETYMGTYIDENDLNLERKFGYKYRSLKGIYPDAYKLPETKVSKAIDVFYDGDADEDVTTMTDRVRNYTLAKDQEWKAKYFGEAPKPQESYSSTTIKKPSGFAQKDKKDDRNCTIIDDVYVSTISDGNRVYKGTKAHEGGFSNRASDLGGATNFGITQNTLTQYNNWNSPYRQGFNLPNDVKFLTNNQAKQILNDMYFKRHSIDRICNKTLAHQVFDQLMSTTSRTPAHLSAALNKVKNINFNANDVVTKDMAKYLNSNNISEKDLSDIKDYLTQEGMNYYFSSIDRNPQNINHINGWYNRRKNYYSDGDEFDKLYLNKKNEYLQKYKNYYTGK